MNKDLKLELEELKQKSSLGMMNKLFGDDFKINTEKVTMHPRMQVLARVNKIRSNRGRGRGRRRGPTSRHETSTHLKQAQRNKQLFRAQITKKNSTDNQEINHKNKEELSSKYHPISSKIILQINSKHEILDKI